MELYTFCVVFYSFITGVLSNQTINSSKYLQDNSLECLSCKNQCGKLNKTTLCYCDEDCTRYSDCCPDYQGSCNGQLLYTKPKYTCMFQKYVINYCPHSVKACERSKIDINTRIPVTGRNTGEHYVNTICALCNGINDVIPWNVNVSSDIDINIKRRLGTHQGLSNLTLHIQPPIGSKDRLCIDDKTDKGIQVIGDCSQTWEDSDVRKACIKGHRQYVNVKYIIYKNIHCAVCNYRNISDLECKAYQYTKQPWVPSLYSYRLYFNFGTVHGLTIDQICAPGFVFTSTEEKCVLIDTSQDRRVPNIVLNMTLFHNKIILKQRLPNDEAQQVIKYLQKSFINVNFTVEYVNRNWDGGFDNYQIRANIVTEHPHQTGLIVPVSTEAVSILTNQTFEGFRTVIVNIYITQNVNNCYSIGVPHVEGSFISDEQGKVTLLEGYKGTYNPGEYIYHTHTLVTCWKHQTDDIIGWVTIVTMSLSILCLIVHLILNVVYKPTLWWRTTGLACCLMIINITFLIQPLVTFNFTACYLAGVVLHWSFLVSFAWMDFIAIEIWNAVKSSTTSRDTDSSMRSSIIKMICILTFPTLIVISAIIIDPLCSLPEWSASYGSGVMCWIKGRYVILYLFIIPGAFSLLISIIFTVLSAFKLISLWRLGKNTVSKQRSYFFMFIRLSVMTGVGWCVGFLALPTNNMFLFIIFVLFTATQGIGLLIVIWGGECKLAVDKKLRSSKDASNNESKDNKIEHQCSNNTPLVDRRT